MHSQCEGATVAAFVGKKTTAVKQAIGVAPFVSLTPIGSNKQCHPTFIYRRDAQRLQADSGMARFHNKKIEYRLIRLRGQCVIWSNIVWSCEMDSAMDKAMKPAIEEKDILGASLQGRDPNSLKILELKRWLIYRNASTKGKKAEVVLR